MHTKKPTLLIMAAGMGSRYGGLKQIDPIGPSGEIIMDYSLWDARKAGFERVVFVIKEEFADMFDETIGRRIKPYMEVIYAFQRQDDLPYGYEVPEGRVKPWGTGHAVLAARDVLDGPFACLNADDYYGPESFAKIYAYLTEEQESGKAAMCVWQLNNTTSPHGHVARGICEIDAGHNLMRIVERKKIKRDGDQASFTEDDGATWQPLAGSSPVSMNFWGFGAEMVGLLTHGMVDFLDITLQTNPLMGEFLLPTFVDSLIQSGQLTVRTIPVKDRWFGVTYREDKESVMRAVADLHASGQYPTPLWSHES